MFPLFDFTDYVGIDYGAPFVDHDAANRGPNGIRYGVISMNSLGEVAQSNFYDNAENVFYQQIVDERDQLKAQLLEVVKLVIAEGEEDVGSYVDVLIESIDAKATDYEGLGGKIVNDFPEALKELQEWSDTSIANVIEERVDDAFDRMTECLETEISDLYYEDDGYNLIGCLQNDIMVAESPFYTYAQFCSPCIPGAGNLDFPLNPDKVRDTSPKVYCLGTDWFNNGVAPYPIFKVEDDTQVYPIPECVLTA